MDATPKTSLTKDQQQRLFALMGKDLRAVNLGQKDTLCVTPLTPMAYDSAEEMISQIELMRNQAYDRATRRIRNAHIAREEAKKSRLKNVVGDSELFRLSYIPVVIAELVWDYADTVISMSRRSDKTKPLSRTIRKCRETYEKQLRHSGRIDPDNIEDIRRNGYLFEESTADITEQMLLNLRLDLQRQFPLLEDKSIDLLCGVYQCHILSRALLRYIDKSVERFERDYPGYEVDKSRLMPGSLKALDLLIEEYIGDKPASDSFNRLKEQYITTFANQIGLITLNKTNDEDNPSI